MPSQKSVIIATALGVAAIVALSLFVINSLYPIKLIASLPSFNLPQASSSATKSTTAPADWQTPQASPAGQPQFLVLVSPSDNLITTDSQVPLRGQTTTDSYVFLNEAPVTVGNDGSFNQVVPLNTGANGLVVSTINDSGVEKLQSVFVLQIPQLVPDLKIAKFTGVISDIEGTTIKFVTDKGASESVTINQFTRFLRKYGGALTSSELATNQEVEVVAVGSDAFAFRVLSNLTRITVLTGTVSKADTVKLELQLPNGKTVTMEQTDTLINSKVGDHLRLQGLFDERGLKLSAITLVARL